MIQIFTDGSSRGNPGQGGYAVIVMKDKDLLKMEKYFLDSTTNNQAELKAILRALELAQNEYKKEICYIYSDSAYCVNICNNWIFDWRERGWRRDKNQEVKNLDIIIDIYKYVSLDFKNFQIKKINGHMGEIGNELADAAATFNRNKFFRIARENNVNIEKVDF